jgi:hypothetical protein
MDRKFGAGAGSHNLLLRLWHQKNCRNMKFRRAVLFLKSTQAIKYCLLKIRITKEHIVTKKAVFKGNFTGS